MTEENKSSGSSGSGNENDQPRFGRRSRRSRRGRRGQSGASPSGEGIPGPVSGDEASDAGPERRREQRRSESGEDRQSERQGGRRSESGEDRRSESGEERRSEPREERRSEPREERRSEPREERRSEPREERRTESRGDRSSEAPSEGRSADSERRRGPRRSRRPRGERGGSRRSSEDSEKSSRGRSRGRDSGEGRRGEPASAERKDGGAGRSGRDPDRSRRRESSRGRPRSGRSGDGGQKGSGSSRERRSGSGGGGGGRREAPARASKRPPRKGNGNGRGRSGSEREQPKKPTATLTLPPKPVRVMIAGGGTGGHIIPALSIGEALKKRNPATELLFLGSDRGLERETIGKAGYRLEEFSLNGLPRSFNLGSIRAGWGMLRAYRRIRKLISEFKPTVMVGTGGYVTVPGALAARLSRVPLVIQEQNSIPGRANRLLARFADEVHIHFTESRRYFRDRGKLRLSGNPVRIEIPEGKAAHTRKKYRLYPDRRTVLILGGSQGAHSLNVAFREMLTHFRQDRTVQFVIQTGTKDYREVLDGVRDSGVRVVVKSYLHQIEELYGVSDLVVARAGAMTVSEISACGLPSVLVPYPHAMDDHQTANARALSDKGAAVLIPDHELSGERLAEEIRDLLAEPGKLRVMGRYAYALSRPNASHFIAEAVERLGGGAPEGVLNLPEEYDEEEGSLEA